MTPEKTSCKNGVVLAGKANATKLAPDNTPSVGLVNYTVQGYPGASLVAIHRGYSLVRATSISCFSFGPELE